MTSRIVDQEHLDKATGMAHGFGIFIGSLVGLDRHVVAEALNELMAEEGATAGQTEFIDMVIKHLTERA